jgi:hypothetical protein
MSKKKESTLPLTRSRYFFKELYRNAAAEPEIAYNKRIYIKSDELREIERRSSRIQLCLLLALVVMFLLTSRYHNIWIVVIYLVAVVVGEAVRFAMLPKNITDHLTDSGRMER